MLRFGLLFVLASILFAQSSPAPTNNDLFVMVGSDFVRPGLHPKSNLNIGIGHTVEALHGFALGDELTFAYTYENNGSHGFWKTQNGTHTETLGLMKNFSIPRTSTVSGYTWAQMGLTSFTGFPRVENRFYNGYSLGLIVHLSRSHSIWIQESYNKVVTVPWYTTTSIGYTRSW